MKIPDNAGVPASVPTEVVDEDTVHLVPDGNRASRWSLSMAWWGLFSAMFWLYVGAASADSVGVVNTLVGLTLSVISYGIINAALSRYAARTGESVELLSRRIFGIVGAAMGPLLLAATALYYAVFEGSIVAIAFQQYFGGSIDLWYLLCVLYMVPLVIGGVATWLDKLNGILLPFYVIGLIAIVVVTTMQRGAPTDFFEHGSASGPLPGWVGSYLIYMGVWILMMYTVDFARLGRPADQRSTLTSPLAGCSISSPLASTPWWGSTSSWRGTLPGRKRESSIPSSGHWVSRAWR
ncbi:hypothetical protein [Millisia brevis]|uniref:hypothetical protein n=1 Tax=Millisia brevis TaxID=264148 RepID=UPI00082F845B|nr:hypothetical protein [Millisia brevis]